VTSPITLPPDGVYTANTALLSVASSASTTTERVSPPLKKLSGKFPCQKIRW
jgi:hypothetical protein